MLLGFNKRFRQPILIETKGFTLRDKRKITPKIGETLYMYSSLRTKHSEFISNSYKLRGIENVTVVIKVYKDYCDLWISINDQYLTDEDVDLFVVQDGFESASDFVEYWTNNYKITRIDKCMEMYRWIDLKFKYVK